MHTLNRKLIAAAIAAASLLPAAGHAEPATYAEQDRGFGWGVLIGALAGGPLGAAIGGAGGAILGEGQGMRNELAETRLALAEARESAAAAEARLAANEGAAADFAAFTEERQIESDALLGLAQGVTVSYPFRSGSDRIEPHVAEQLSRLAGTLSRLPQVSVRVEGYTDVRGGDRANQGLSERRAQAVAAALTGAGIDAARVVVRSHGEVQALAAADDEEGWFFDRRAVVSFLVEE